MPKIDPASNALVKDGDPCHVIAGTHKGKSGVVRDLNTSKNTIVFRTNMEAGHGGKSGRFRQYRERAEMFAFMLDQLGVASK